MVRRQTRHPQTVQIERFGADGTIERGRVYPVWWLSMIWERADQRKLEQALERAGIPILRLGGGDNLVRGDDVWRAFDRLGSRPADT